MKNRIKSDLSILRHKAEEMLHKTEDGKRMRGKGEKVTDQSIQLSESEFQKLINELDLCKLELEMRNEQLMSSKNEAEIVTDKYTKLYYLAPLGYITLSKEGIITELNICAAELLKNERTSLKNSRFDFFVSENSRVVFNQFLDKVFQSKVKESCEIILSVAGNLSTHLYLTGLVENDGDQCLVIATEITQLKQSEKSLRESEEKYRVILDNIQDVFYQINMQGTVVEISPSIKNLSEFDRNEIIGCPAKNFYFSQNERAQFLKNITEKGAVQDYELQFTTKSGQLKVVSVNARMIFNKEGTPDHIDGSMRDITRRKMAEENLRKLQKAIENAKVSVVITDKTGTIEFANPFFTQLTGYTKEEYMGKNPSVLKSGCHTQAFYQEFWDTIESGKTWEGEFCNRKKNGELYWEKAVISPIYNENNEITHFAAIKTDITEAKKNNEELIAAKLHAEESDNLKTAFLNNISHEIRTPFNGILGFLSILQNDDITTAERDEYTKIINESAFRLMNTINDITEVSQIQTGQIHLNESEISISQLLDNLIDPLKSDCEIKGLTFTVSNQVPFNMTNICTDHLKLNTILNNLLSNAVKFTREGSVELTVRIKETANNISDFGIRDKACLVSNTELEFSVKDTGIGIPESKLHTIFEPFVQGDISNTRQFEGSGLGITIARAYVELLGGTIEVESIVGRGSVFRFTIPYRTDCKKNSTLNYSIPDELKKQSELLKILITEDDEASSMLLSITIKALCEKPLFARTGAEAVEACRNNPDIDLVLMDIKMPEMDGYEATAQIRQFNTDIIIIAQTAYALTGDMDRAIASGCNDYITKPILNEHLMAIVKKYFKRHDFNLL